MARSSNSGSTDGTTAAQARFTVALPGDVGEQIDALGARLTESMRKQTGIGVELSRAQIVTSVVVSALKTFEEVEATASADGDGSPEA